MAMFLPHANVLITHAKGFTGGPTTRVWMSEKLLEGWVFKEPIGEM
jgi:hypothetical protein